MIEVISIGGIRNQKKSTLKLGMHNLIVGPNGSGKTAHVAGLQWLLNGCLPGHGPSEAFLNACGDEMMASAIINGRTIERRLTKGKTLSETVTLDGAPVKTGRGGAEGIIQAAFGPKPLLMDLIAFQRMTSSEQRREILSMVCTPQELAGLTDKEAKARDAKNDGQRRAREAAATLATLTKSLADQKDRPVGDVEVIRAALAEANKDIQGVQANIERGKANERARTAYHDAKANLAGIKEELAILETSLTEAREAFAKAAEDLKAHEAKKPVAPPGPKIQLPASAVVELTEILEAFKEMTNGKADVLAPVAPELKAIYARLRALVPNRAAHDAYVKLLEPWEGALAILVDAKEVAQSALSAIVQDHNSAKAAAGEAEKHLAAGAGIGPGLDPEDEATLAGLQKRRDDLAAKVQALDKIGALTAEIEKARLAVEKAEKNAEGLNKALAAVLEAQADVVEEAAHEVAERSALVLPDGHALIEDDGKDVRIRWGRGDGRRIPWETLSGGEKAMFDCALGHALLPEALVIIEGAEVDNANMGDLLLKLGDVPFEVCILTCHPPMARAITGEEVIMYPVEASEWTVHALAPAVAGVASEA